MGWLDFCSIEENAQDTGFIDSDFSSDRQESIPPNSFSESSEGRSSFTKSGTKFEIKCCIFWGHCRTQIVKLHPTQHYIMK